MGKLDQNEMGNSVSPSRSPAVSPVSQFFTRMQLTPELDDQASKAKVRTRIARDDVFERSWDGTKVALTSSTNHPRVTSPKTTTSPKRSAASSAQSTQSARSTKMLDTAARRAQEMLDSCHTSSARMQGAEPGPKQHASVAGDRQSRRRKSLDNPPRRAAAPRPAKERRGSVDSIYAVLASHRAGAQAPTDSKRAMPNRPAYISTQRSEAAAPVHLQSQRPKPGDSPYMQGYARLCAVIKLQALQRGRVVRAQQDELQAVKAIYMHLHGNMLCASPLSSSLSPVLSPGACAVSRLVIPNL